MKNSYSRLDKFLFRRKLVVSTMILVFSLLYTANYYMENLVSYKNELQSYINKVESNKRKYQKLNRDIKLYSEKYKKIKGYLFTNQEKTDISKKIQTFCEILKISGITECRVDSAVNDRKYINMYLINIVSTNINNLHIAKVSLNYFIKKYTNLNIKNMKIQDNVLEINIFKD